ncbi:hypothetical protein [Nocardia acidivorans]|uniref:hypothetical protein n=1 Tax=Nocardia acidivorans TaxID=404580 RepID=UPI000829CD82|nr:hypothetical protein [Nocardia acidivorans]
MDNPTTTRTAADLAGTVHSAIEDAMRALDAVTPYVDALDAHPDEPSTYEIRRHLAKAAEALTDAAGQADADSQA